MLIWTETFFFLHLLVGPPQAGETNERLQKPGSWSPRRKTHFFFQSHEFWWDCASAEPEVEQRIGARPVLIPIKTSSWSESRMKLQLWGFWWEIGNFQYQWFYGNRNGWNRSILQGGLFSFSACCLRALVHFQYLLPSRLTEHGFKRGKL